MERKFKLRDVILMMVICFLIGYARDINIEVELIGQPELEQDVLEYNHSQPPRLIWPEFVVC